MINVSYGDILDCKDGIICHQVNCMGVMGAGLALQIKNKYPLVFKNYVTICEQCPKEILLGMVQLVDIDENTIIANLFSQSDYGYNGNYTDYDMFKRCVKTICDLMIQHHKNTVYFPYKIGCGIAGGSWKMIYNIINEYFDDSPFKCNIIVFDKNVPLDEVKV